MRIHNGQLAIVAVLVLAIANLGFVGSAQAGIIGTDVLIRTDRSAQLELIQTQLDRAEVRAELEKFGVDRSAIDQRIANLSDSELAVLAKRMQDAPAGGDVFALIGVVFVVLLVLELVGVIDIFKKIP